MPVFEITLNGFDGSTDKTDDKVFWLAIDEDLSLQIELFKPINSIIEDMHRIDIPMDSGGIDLRICKQV